MSVSEGEEEEEEEEEPWVEPWVDAENVWFGAYARNMPSI